jgi:AcrR family transcriptional regulator
METLRFWRAGVGLRQDKKDELRRRLYETTIDSFRERGFVATRIKDVIERVGVSEATFFNYFPTKEAVLQQSAAETKQWYGVFLQHLAARGDEPITERLRELARVMAAVCAADREFLATVLTRTSLFSDPTGADRDTDLENFGHLAGLFAQGQQRGEIDPSCDTLQLAEIFIAIQTLTITNWVTHWWGDVGDLEPRMLAALDVMLAGCHATATG